MLTARHEPTSLKLYATLKGETDTTKYHNGKQHNDSGSHWRTGRLRKIHIMTSLHYHHLWRGIDLVAGRYNIVRKDGHTTG